MIPVPVYITFFTSLVLIVMSIYIIGIKNKATLHYSFLSVVIGVLIWTLAVMVRGLVISNYNAVVFWENFTYIGISFVPVMLIFLAMAYSQPDKPLSKKLWLLLIVPAITQIMAWMNGSHGWFYVQYGWEIAGTQNIPGPYFYIHAAYSYVCLLVGFILMSYFAIRNSGIISVQAVLILIGSLVPTIVNVFFTLKVPGFDLYSTPIAFSATLAMYLLGMFRFNLLRVAPIALQTVINRISDGFVVIDTNYNIIDYNRTFEDTFKNISEIRKGGYFDRVIGNWARYFDDVQRIRDGIEKACVQNITIITDIVLTVDDNTEYFTVECTPIFQQNRCRAVILLFKNVTQHIRDMEKIKENQAILLERERLASLGQLIGGIAHNLKTPIMSIAGGIEQLQYLTKEYETSVGDPDVTLDDHAEIAQDMYQWLGKMKMQAGYMSDIISTVKDQATKFVNPSHLWFTLDEMLKRVKILMQHEIVKNQCRFTQDIRVAKETRIPGDVNSLVQILDNVIVNAIQAYDAKGGEIILQVTSQGNKLLITICDFGKGIDEKVKDRLFKEMITTKGKHGTGLGLYMSHSTVKGIFRGNMWFESSLGQGTKFYIQLPLFEEETGETKDA
jgi:two-component system sensor histidine kinase HupT/HoxJ